jgi:hypothetical protein
MAHPELVNHTPFAAEAHFATDEDGQPLVVPIVKATFDVDARGTLAVAEEQVPVDFIGSTYGDPGESSIRFESDIAFVKPSTDCVLLGHAHPPHSRATQVDVTFRAGKLEKTVRVTGDRQIVGGVSPGISPPRPFERMPLVYERAFGGTDRSPESEAKWGFEPRNPVGVGFVSRYGRILEGSPLPNLEDPLDRLEVPGGRCRPVGFGFISPDWLPRATFGGTYDESWMNSRAPLLPRDFNRRFFNSASEGLTASEFMVGNEWVQVLGATPEGNWIFQLPGLENPRCSVHTRFDGAREILTEFDTLIVDADARRLILVWRGHMAIRDGPLDLVGMTVECTNAPEGRPDLSGHSSPEPRGP